MINANISLPQSNESLALAISGPDARKFLQGQLTCDVNSLQHGQDMLGAYCNIKGRVESLFRLYHQDDAYIMQLHPDLLVKTQQELQKYAIFSKVTINTIPDVFPSNDDLTEINSKIPAIYANTIGAFFPHDINLHHLGAVSFTKGCYRGQEIVARMQHRGNLKRGLYKFQIAHAAPGDTIKTQDGTDVGMVVRSARNVAGSIGLAVINFIQAQDQLFINSLPLQIES